MDMEARDALSLKAGKKESQISFANKQTTSQRSRSALQLAAGLLCALPAAGCGGLATEGQDVIASVINVTPHEITVMLSGVQGDEVDSVERTIAASSSTDVRFACLDQLVIGDANNPQVPGVLIQAGGAEPVPIDAFALIAGESFACGEIVEIIVSGNDADSFAVDVFALKLPQP